MRAARFDPSPTGSGCSCGAITNVTVRQVSANSALPARATGSPVEALAWIEADERFDVGILDMHMPEMDGVALARAIRERPAGPALPLILFTSLGRREARADSESHRLIRPPGEPPLHPGTPASGKFPFSIGPALPLA